MDCNRYVVEQIIDIVCENSSIAKSHFEKPLVVQILSYEKSEESENYSSLFLTFFRLLGNAVIREQING